MKKGICCAGNMIVDITYPIETWPKQNELTHITEGIQKSTGGAVCNTITDLARLDPNLRLVASGFAGHDAEGDFLLEEYADKIFSFATRFHAVVLIHPEKEASYILPIADRYPDVTFIMAHLEDKDHVDAIEFALHKNVYTDTSGIASSKNLIIEYAHNRVGADHILFGTDTYAASFQRGRIEFALIPSEDKKCILRGNALRIFGSHIK